jgi:hypothetical protein
MDVAAPITVPVLPTASQAQRGLGPPKVSVCTVCETVVYETVYETPTTIVIPYNERVDYSNPLQGSGATLAWLGLLVGSTGASAYMLGADAIDTVAIQCIGGRGFERYCIYHSNFNLEKRWAGMNAAFGSDKEILPPEQTEMEVEVPRPLTRADYDQLLQCANRRLLAHLAPTSQIYNGLTVIPGVPANSHLVQRQVLPLWKWAARKHGVLRAGICYVLALLPVALIACARFCAGHDMVYESVFSIVFIAYSAYAAYQLDIQREITYIKVDENDVSPQHGALWANQLDRALTGPPFSADHAIHELATGQVRKESEKARTLLVPVMALKPRFGHDEHAKSRTTLFSDPFLRSFFLNNPFLLTKDRSHRWLGLYGIASILQALLQNRFAKAFLRDAKPYEVNWFRRIPGHIYREEFPRYRVRLKADSMLAM